MKNISFFKPVLLCFSLLGIMASCDDKEELPPLQPPTAVKAVVTDAPPGIKVSWNVAEGADYYSVYVAEGEASQTAVPFSEYAFCGTSGSASFTYTVVEEGMGYYFAVKSCRHEDREESSFSSPAFCLYAEGVSGGGDDEGDSPSLLQPPSNVRAVQEGSSVTVSWSSVQGAAGYNVYRVKDVASTSSAQRIERGVLATSVTDKPSSSGTYYYYVRTMDSNGDLSDYSAAARCSFTSGGSGGDEDGEGDEGGEDGNLDAPTGVTASNEGSAMLPNIAVRWNPVQGATGYKVYRGRTADGSYSLLGNTGGATHYYDRNPLDGSNYYKVKAVNGKGESNYSSYAYYENGGSSSLVPATPQVEVSGTSTISLSWTCSTGSGFGTAESYEVYKRNPETSAFELLTTTTSRSYRDADPHPGINRYGVVAVNDAGKSGMGYGYSKEIPLSRPTSFSATKSGSNVKFTWSKVDGATGYQIFSSSSASGSYYIFEDIDSGNTTSATVYYPASSGTTTYFKIRAYWRTSGGGSPVYSDYSSYKSVRF